MLSRWLASYGGVGVGKNTEQWDIAKGTGLSGSRQNVKYRAISTEYGCTTHSVPEHIVATHPWVSLLGFDLESVGLNAIATRFRSPISTI